MTRIYDDCSKCGKRTNNRHLGKPRCVTHLDCRWCGRKARQLGPGRKPICAACVMIRYRRKKKRAA